MMPPRSATEMSLFCFDDAEYAGIEKKEMQEIFLFRSKMLDKEEAKIEDMLKMLNKEKVMYHNEIKRMRDEDQSKFCNLVARKSP